jgi:hypothetical protein
MFDHLHPHWKFSRKTLIKLNLNGNKIGDDGAKHLANALKVNQVRLQGAPLSASHWDFFWQTLTTLNLGANSMESAAAVEVLADTLETSLVWSFRFHSTYWSQLRHLTDTDWADFRQWSECSHRSVVCRKSTTHQSGRIHMHSNKYFILTILISDAHHIVYPRLRNWSHCSTVIGKNTADKSGMNPIYSLL